MFDNAVGKRTSNRLRTLPRKRRRKDVALKRVTGILARLEKGAKRELEFKSQVNRLKRRMDAEMSHSVQDMIRKCLRNVGILSEPEVKEEGEKTDNENDDLLSQEIEK